MPIRRLGSKIPLLLALIVLPGAAWAQAAVQSDTPVPRRDGALSSDSALPTTGAGTRDAGVPNSVDGPGSPGTTGTGAAGTGPTNTMAAPGR